MMAEYDIVGNLYWATENYTNALTGDFLDEYYSESKAIDSQLGEGDGKLFYPGIKYGIDGPIVTMRFEAVRDGNEEFEMWYAIDEAMKAVDPNVDIAEAIRLTASAVYTGTQVKRDNDAFKLSRDALITLAKLADAEKKSFITGFTDDGEGNYTVEIYSELDEVKSNGAALSGSVKGEGKTYTVAVKAENKDNYLKLDFGGTKFEMRLGGKVTAYGLDKLIGNIVKDNATVEATLTEGAVGEFAAGELIRLSIGKTSGKAQTVKITGEAAGAFNANTSSVRIKIYSNSDQTVNLSVLLASSGKNTYTIAKENVTLVKGMNEVVINSVESLEWSRMKTATGIVLRIGDTTGADARDDIYLGGITAYEL